MENLEIPMKINFEGPRGGRYRVKYITFDNVEGSLNILFSQGREAGHVECSLNSWDEIERIHELLNYDNLGFTKRINKLEQIVDETSRLHEALEWNRPKTLDYCDRLVYYAISAKEIILLYETEEVLQFQRISQDDLLDVQPELWRYLPAAILDTNLTIKDVINDIRRLGIRSEEDLVSYVQDHYWREDAIAYLNENEF